MSLSDACSRLKTRSGAVMKFELRLKLRGIPRFEGYYLDYGALKVRGEFVAKGYRKKRIKN